MELKLKGAHIFSALKLIKQLNLKDYIIDISKQYVDLKTKQDKEHAKVRAIFNEEGKELNSETVALFYAEHEDFAKAELELQNKAVELKQDGIFKIVDILGTEEMDKVVYKFLSEVYGVTIEEIENLGFEEMIKAILDIVSSDELVKAFSVVLK